MTTVMTVTQSSCPEEEGRCGARGTEEGGDSDAAKRRNATGDREVHVPASAATRHRWQHLSLNVALQIYVATNIV